MLNGVNFTVQRGEKWGILGHNGAGKSTLLRIIGGVEMPTSGHVEMDMSVSWPLAFSGAFQGSLSGLDNLRFIARIYNRDYDEMRRFVDDFSELGQHLREPVKNYSSGMKARLAFALSIAIEFDSYLIDEVAMVGDARFAERCRQELFEKRKDRALVIVSHSMEYIRDVCDHSMVLQDGKMTICNSVQEGIDTYNKLLTGKVLKERTSETDKHYINTFQFPAGEKTVSTDPSSIQNKIVTEEDVELLFQSILKRSVNNDEYRAQCVRSKTTVLEMINQLLNSEEFYLIAKNDVDSRSNSLLVSRSDILGENYRNPTTLRVNQSNIKRVLIVGSCLSEAWANAVPSLEETFETELYLFSNDLPEQPVHPIGSYNFQILQIPIRNVLPDGAFAKIQQGDMQAHQDLLDHVKSATRMLLRSGLRWNQQYGITTFVFSFILPQQNYIGKMLDRYSIENPVHFIEELNKFIAEEIKKYTNVFFYDINDTMASVGRQYINEDMITSFNHGSMIGDFDFEFDQNRLEVVQRAPEIYDAEITLFLKSGWNELIAMYRIVRQVDSVKMVVVDIDDTLWRGVIAEHAPSEMPTTEGWPRAFWETLLLLKRRGIILAIISKNEETVVREAWPHIMGKMISLDDFAVRRINWRQKSENMKEILQIVNVLPNSVVFIDDNPAQRSDIKSIYPDMRVLGGNPILWRHILLAAAETQTSKISSESSNRTEMIKAQVEREDFKNSVSQEEFIKSLDIKYEEIEINDVENEGFFRSFELLNKTNQFNTTGERWSQEACQAAFAQGMKFVSFKVEDKFTAYGLVVVALVQQNEIKQFIMSCRVMGLGVEEHVTRTLLKKMRDAGYSFATARLVETEKNLPCRSIFKANGFALTETQNEISWWEYADLQALRPADI
ncbi:HAD-IIIC family phosphatase [Gluconacetobacter dulcium]|uniref:HAD-IIIC family phosphatase n=1 Tax=Gluconacetobacter dulcium TaxID=2729096 RepID=UPI00287BB693|nr:HAD-IIIC family phosphatase [Gluconacetobacter dulcium]